MKLEEELREFLRHPDTLYQEWLDDAITSYFEGKECPPLRRSYELENDVLEFLSILVYWLQRDMGTPRQDNTIRQIANLAEELRQKVVNVASAS